MTAGMPAGRRHPAWIEIDHDALRHNLGVLASLAEGAGLAPVVKADGYGHGMRAVARTLEAAGVRALCVATVDEAFALRDAGVGGPILLLYPAPADALPELVRQGIELAVSTPGGVADVVAACRARPSGPPVVVHLEVETGLTRMGIVPERIGEAAAALAAVGGVTIAGIWSHVADPGDADRCARQLAALEAAVASFGAIGLPVPARHLAASGGLLAGGVPTLELVRPGIAVYGVIPDDLPIAPDRAAAASSLRPVMRIAARPIRVLEVPAGTAVSYGGRWVAERPSTIATIPVGYGDGYARSTGPGAEVLIRGRRVPVVGTIAMDAMMADVTDLADITSADEVVILGSQGSERIGVHELARRRGSISWEVLTGMALRLPRIDIGTGGERATGSARSMQTGPTGR